MDENYPCDASGFRDALFEVARDLMDGWDEPMDKAWTAAIGKELTDILDELNGNE